MLAVTSFWTSSRVAVDLRCFNVQKSNDKSTEALPYWYQLLTPGGYRFLIITQSVISHWTICLLGGRQYQLTVLIRSASYCAENNAQLEKIFSFIQWNSVNVFQVVEWGLNNLHAINCIYSTLISHNRRKQNGKLAVQGPFLLLWFKKMNEKKISQNFQTMHCNRELYSEGTRGDRRRWL